MMPGWGAFTLFIGQDGANLSRLWSRRPEAPSLNYQGPVWAKKIEIRQKEENYLTLTARLPSEPRRFNLFHKN
jgi:hypothetical protein